tara:strand:+ start:26828 stop:27010 length:183 start_codon:yes stop_codon:yes gene_type:complete
MIKITEATLSRMIEYMREYIFKLTGDDDSDRATHPLDMPFLDYLIELRSEYRRKQKDASR